MGMMMKYIVRLQDDSVGCIESSSLGEQQLPDLIGETVTYRLHDENGVPFEKEGVLVEILEELEN